MGAVTLKDIYEVVNRVEEKMDERMSRVETRLGLLEDFRSKALGIMSILTIALSGLFSFIWKKIEG